MIRMLPPLDADETAFACRRDLDVSRVVATELGRSAVVESDVYTRTFVL